MRAQPGQLDRALSRLTIGLVQGQQFRERVLYDTHSGEWDQQVQINFSGSAGNEWGFVDTSIMFEYPFLYAPAQRLVPFERPHFSKGIELLTPSPDLVHLDAQIHSWNINESGWIIGCQVRLLAVAPAASTDAVLFSAVAHLTFQGYAAYAEGDEYQQ